MAERKMSEAAPATKIPIPAASFREPLRVVDFDGKLTSNSNTQLTSCLVPYFFALASSCAIN